MEQPRQTEFTADEFIAWALEQPTGRFELDNGTVVAMAPERASHATAKGNAFMALRNAISARGLACQAFPDGLSVRIDDRTVYEPDAPSAADRDWPGTRSRPTTRSSSSRSSRRRAGGSTGAQSSQATSCCRACGTSSDRRCRKRVVIHNHRGDEGRIEVRILHDGSLMLDPPGLTVEVPDIFVGL